MYEPLEVTKFKKCNTGRTKRTNRLLEDRREIS